MTKNDHSRALGTAGLSKNASVGLLSGLMSVILEEASVAASCRVSLRRLLPVSGRNSTQVPPMMPQPPISAMGTEV